MPARTGREARCRAASVAALLALSGAGHAATVTVRVHAGAGAPLADAVVFLESPDGPLPVRPRQGVEIAQVERRFVPAVSVVPVGTEVRFPNRDNVRHHVYSFSPTKTFEIKLYAGTPANPVTFDRSGIVVLGCNIHDSMTGWVVVVDTPYYGLSGADGRVMLADVPPGSYRLRSWHPGLPAGSPAFEQRLVVGAAASSVDVGLPGVVR
jgi:plastocyanin